VQSIDEDCDSGTTTITVGPPKFLGVHEIMDWMRGLRRANSGKWQSRVSGFGGGGGIMLASRAHKESISAGKEVLERLMLMRGNNAEHTEQTLTARIILDILHAFGKEIKLREIKVCDEDTGLAQYQIHLCSEPYPAPLDPGTPA
jgi:hypothetical protein